MTATGTQPQLAETPAGGRRPRWLLRVLALVLLLTIMTPVVAATYVVLTAGRNDRTATDAIIVLGAAQYSNRPSPVLEARLAHAKSLYGQGVAPRIITVGGNQPGDISTEAQAGRSWLSANGVPASKIIAVPKGGDTLTSLTAATRVMADRGWSSATIVTDPAHEARSIAMARALGIDAHPSPTQQGPGSALTIDYAIRETAGLLLFWLIDRRSVQNAFELP